MFENDAQPGSPCWFSQVPAAEIVNDADTTAWDDTTDFVVVGYGGAGISAAVMAAEQGLSVIAIDRFDGGGSTAMNGGVYYAGGTSVQAEGGIDDSTEEMYKYLKTEVRDVVEDSTLRRFCEESPESVEWLKKHGVGFNSRAYMKKINYPDPSYYLYHPDNSLNEQRRKIARPAPRGHRVLAPPKDIPTGYGVYLTQPMSESAERLGVDFRPQCEARRLVVDRSGRVVGLVALELPPGTEAWERRRKLQAKANRWMTMLPITFPGAFLTYARANKLLAKVAKLEEKYRVERRIRAKAGICLSAGGFIFNRPMVHHYGEKYDQGMPMGQPGDDGSGIRLGQTAGGAVGLMRRFSAWRGINPPDTFPHYPMVNGKGERYIDESLYMTDIGNEMCERQGGVGYIILDQAGNKATWKELLFGNLMGFQRKPAILTMLVKRKKAGSLKGLASKLGMDASALQRTVDDYNKAARGEMEDPFLKSRADMWEIGKGPYYAVDVSIANSLLPMSTMTVGGLKVDESTGQVKGDDGSVIRGLYAAGRTAIGLCSQNYVSGLSMADCVFSGRRAAKAVADTFLSKEGPNAASGKRVARSQAEQPSG